MNKRISTAIIVFAALSLCSASGCTTAASAPADALSDTGTVPDAEDTPGTDELTEHFETGSEFLLEDIEIVEATESPGR